MSRSFLRRQFLLGLSLLGVAARSVAAPRSTFNVREFRAVGDGVSLNTAPIQAAIDACAGAGGGTVWFPAGRYVSGTIVLKSHVVLELDAGAMLVGSKNLADYPSHIPAFRSFTDTYTEKSLIYAEGAQHIGIRGLGTIDGQGAEFQGAYKVRPYIIRFVNCRSISIADVTLQNSPMWVQHYLACDDVAIRGIRVHSRVNRNNDGIDIDSCRRVRISDCEITSGDDAIVLKSTSDRVCQDVAVSNCVLSSACYALKLGTESNGGFENIVMSSCSIYDTQQSGVALEMVDGGTLDGVVISNLVMKNVGSPIFIRLGDRARPFLTGGPRPAVGALRNITISNIEVTGASKTGCAIAGLPGHAIENLLLENIRITFDGGGQASEGRREIPENPSLHPKFSMFGILPAYGYYCRHVRGLRLRNVQTNLASADGRPALVCDDVERLEVAGADFDWANTGEPCIRLVNTRDAFLSSNHPRWPGRTWLQVTGARSRGVTLVGNDLRDRRKAVDVGSDVPQDAVSWP